MNDAEGSESMDTSRSSRSSSPDTPTSSDGFPPLSPATFRFLNLEGESLPLPPQSLKNEVDISSWAALGDDLAVAGLSPPYLFDLAPFDPHVPSPRPSLALISRSACEVYDVRTITPNDLVVSQSSEAYSAPVGRVAPTHVLDTSDSQLAFTPVSTSPNSRDASPFVEVQPPSSNPTPATVVSPPREQCSKCVAYCLPEIPLPSLS